MIQGGGLFLLTVISFFPVLFHVQEILFFILFGLAIVDGWLEDKDLRIRTPIDLPLFLLLAWILLTIPFSLNPEYSFGEWRKLVAQCLVFYWAVHVLRELSRRRFEESSDESFVWLQCMKAYGSPQKIFLGVLLGAFLLSIYALNDFIDRGGNLQDRNIRARAPGSDYNWLSTYFVLSVPIVFYCGATSRFLSGKIMAFGVSGLALLALAASYTRAGWLAFVAQCFSWGFMARRRFFLVTFVFGLILVSVVLVGVAQRGKQADTLDLWTVEARTQVWKLGVDEIIKHPIVGIGYGNNTFQPVLVGSRMGDRPMHLHNTFLMVGVGSGILAFGLFMCVFFCLGRELFSIKDLRHLTDSEVLKCCLGIVLVGFFCRNMFDYMFAGSLAYLFWILMACGLESPVKRMPKTTSHPLGV